MAEATRRREKEDFRGVTPKSRISQLKEKFEKNRRKNKVQQLENDLPE